MEDNEKLQEQQDQQEVTPVAEGAVPTDSQEPQISDLDYLKQRTGKRHPGQQYADDAAYYKQMRADAEDDDKRMADYDANVQAVNDLFAADPRSADWWVTWKRNKGKSPIAALVRTYGSEMLRDGLDDPKLADQIEEAEKEYLDRIAENRNYGEQVQKNLDASLDMADEYAKKNGLTTEEVDGLMAEVFERFKRIHLGQITAEDLDWVRKAQGYDQAVEEAKAEGETLGRNTKIRETLKKGRGGDGIANLGGTAGASGASVPMIASEQADFQAGRRSSSDAPEVRSRQRYNR